MPISLVMIAKNEERCISRALNSVKNFVDEMIIVDTGSTDRTVEIARALGAKVYFFDWIHDFAAARNYALSQATHPWRLILDADEYVIEGAEYLKTLTTLPNTSTSQMGQQVTLISLNEGTPGEITKHQSHLTRIIYQDVYYQGSIHEHPILNSSAVIAPVSIEHDGYLLSTKANKYARNIQMLEEALHHCKQDNAAQSISWYYHHKLASEYLGLGKKMAEEKSELNMSSPKDAFANAQSHFETALSQNEHHLLFTNPNIANDFAEQYLCCLSKTRNFAKGLAFFEKYQILFQNVPGFFYNVNLMFINWALMDSTKISVLLPAIEKMLTHTIGLCERIIAQKIWVPGIATEDYLRLASEMKKLYRFSNA